MIDEDNINRYINRKLPSNVRRVCDYEIFTFNNKEFIYLSYINLSYDPEVKYRMDFELELLLAFIRKTRNDILKKLM